MRLIPAIDLRAGRCVRLFQGDFDRQTEYSDDPVGMARRFSELNVRDLHVVDLDGAQSGEQMNRAIVAKIARETPLAVQLGGGIRDADTIRAWLDSGVARCVVGSASVTEPGTVRQWLEAFGPDRLVLALDVRIDDEGMPWLTTHGWTRTSSTTLWAALDDYSGAGLRHVLCTDISRDGAMTGPNVALYQEVLASYPGLLLQASGGVRNAGDLYALDDAGLPAAISGRALLDGAITADEVASFPQDA
jgi:phosphoribosylformimino-5-aminoimidazole carboxamide ribotide isomerase